jgi:nucleoporin GLE1
MVSGFAPTPEISPFSLPVAALDVFGLDAKVYWGHQWNKLLALLYEGVTVGIGGEDGKLIGGKTAEGNAARTRVQLEVERIMRQDVRFA